MMLAPEPLPPKAWQRRVFPVAASPALDWNRRSIAYHEAGHAVVAMALGLPAHGACVEEGRGGFAMDPLQSLDLARLADLPDSPDFAASLHMLRVTVSRPAAIEVDNTLDLVTVLQAGRQAEILLVNLPWPGLLVGADLDTQQSIALLHEQFESRTALGWCQLRSRALLTQQWAEVEHIAGVLIEHGEWFQSEHPERIDQTGLGGGRPLAKQLRPRSPASSTLRPSFCVTNDFQQIR